MKYWKEIRNQRSVWLFAGGFVLLLGVMTGMLCTLGRRGIIPICGITTALLAMTISYTAELRCNIGRRRALENMLTDGDPDYFEPEEKDRLLHMDDQEMLEQVFDKLHEVSISRALKTEAELHALQNQINPHFLYNTLDTAVWLAEAKQNDQVIRLLTYLSDFFRTSLSNGQNFITIQEEQRHIESYLKIQQFRYQDTLAYNIDIDKALYNFTIPKLLLQPLVENALVHGIRGKRGKGRISVTGRLEGGNIVFCVTDDGVGMDEEKLYNLRKASVAGSTQSANIAAFGVGNVNERIHIYYGENYGLFFKSQPDVGTTARVLIPARNVS